ncbi:unnamed protein product [Bursaphelenchus okinawaensis]|uniref:Uncharacterized protein n=1 Tax=Bursaphelenchus okinawaensis TaxID=465554 RepID=A0A811LM54_9BILA|nr:unnamed protein product [Bursaphelenchus okinawaensis]CAG9124211.1 unnamed protein product [Bursaphelenchus okinawaensis]
MLPLLNQKIASYNQACAMTKWSCEKTCRIQYATSTGQCVKSRDDKCFDLPVKYNFTKDHTSPFPYELAVLRAFPKCWENLNPLVCGTHFRPCGSHRYTEGTENFWMEVWQKYPLNMCIKATEACSFLKDYGLKLDVFECESAESEVRNSRKLFDTNGECKLRYNRISDSDQMCLSPLIRVKGGVTSPDAKPLVDQCYVPCLSSFVEDESRLSNFRSILLSSTVVAAVIFFGALCYILKRSTKGFVPFLNLNIFVFAFLLYVMQSYTLVTHNNIESSSTCVKLGDLYVRRELPTKDLDICLVHSSLISFFFTIVQCFFGVRLASLIFPIRPVNPKMEVCTDGISLKSFIFILIFGFSALFAVVGLLVRPQRPDGITGMCHTPLSSISESLVYYLPIIITNTILCGLLIYYNIKKITKVNSFKMGMYLIMISVVCFGISLILHFFYDYDSTTEVATLQEKIKCVLEYTKYNAGQNFDWEDAVRKCKMKQAGPGSLVMIYFYVVLAPVLPLLVYLVSNFLVLKKFDKEFVVQPKAVSEEDSSLLPPLLSAARPPYSATDRYSRGTKRPHRMIYKPETGSLRSKFCNSAPSKSLNSVQSAQLSHWASAMGSKMPSHPRPVYFTTPASTFSALHIESHGMLPESRAGDFPENSDITDIGRTVAYFRLLQERSQWLAWEEQRKIISNLKDKDRIAYEKYCEDNPEASRRTEFHQYQKVKASEDDKDLRRAEEGRMGTRMSVYRFDPQVNSKESPILAVLTDFLRASKIHRKMEFTQRVLQELQTLMERDKVFVGILHQYANDNALNPGSNNLVGWHILSINQILNLTTLITDENLLLHLAKLTGQAMRTVAYSMVGPDYFQAERTEVPIMFSNSSPVTITAVNLMEEPNDTMKRWHELTNDYGNMSTIKKAELSNNTEATVDSFVKRDGLSGSSVAPSFLEGHSHGEDSRLKVIFENFELKNTVAIEQEVNVRSVADSDAKDSSHEGSKDGVSKKSSTRNSVLSQPECGKNVASGGKKERNKGVSKPKSQNNARGGSEGKNADFAAEKDAKRDVSATESEVKNDHATNLEVESTTASSSDSKTTYASASEAKTLYFDADSTVHSGNIDQSSKSKTSSFGETALLATLDVKDEEINFSIIASARSDLESTRRSRANLTNVGASDLEVTIQRENIDATFGARNVEESGYEGNDEKIDDSGIGKREKRGEDGRQDEDDEGKGKEYKADESCDEGSKQDENGDEKRDKDYEDNAQKEDKDDEKGDKDDEDGNEKGGKDDEDGGEKGGKDDEDGSRKEENQDQNGEREQSGSDESKSDENHEEGDPNPPQNPSLDNANQIENSNSDNANPVEDANPDNLEEPLNLNNQNHGVAVNPNGVQINPEERFMEFRPDIVAGIGIRAVIAWMLDANDAMTPDEGIGDSLTTGDDYDNHLQGVNNEGVAGLNYNMNERLNRIRMAEDNIYDQMLYEEGIGNGQQAAGFNADDFDEYGNDIDEGDEEVNGNEVEEEGEDMNDNDVNEVAEVLNDNEVVEEADALNDKEVDEGDDDLNDNDHEKVPEDFNGNDVDEKVGTSEVIDDKAQDSDALIIDEGAQDSNGLKIEKESQDSDTTKDDAGDVGQVEDSEVLEEEEGDSVGLENEEGHLEKEKGDPHELEHEEDESVELEDEEEGSLELEHVEEDSAIKAIDENSTEQDSFQIEGKENSYPSTIKAENGKQEEAGKADESELDEEPDALEEFQFDVPNNTKETDETFTEGLLDQAVLKLLKLNNENTE